MSQTSPSKRKYITDHTDEELQAMPLKRHRKRQDEDEVSVATMRSFECSEEENASILESIKSSSGSSLSGSSLSSLSENNEEIASMSFSQLRKDGSRFKVPPRRHSETVMGESESSDGIISMSSSQLRKAPLRRHSETITVESGSSDDSNGQSFGSNGDDDDGFHSEYSRILHIEERNRRIIRSMRGMLWDKYGDLVQSELGINPPFGLDATMANTLDKVSLCHAYYVKDHHATKN